MFKFTSIASVVAVLGVAAVAGSILTGCRHSSPEGRADWIVGKVSRQLDLTDVQKAKLEEVKKLVLEIRAKKVGDRDAHFKVAKEQILSAKLDRSVIRKAIQDRQADFDKDFDPVFDKVAEFHASLTPEQKTKAVELIEKFHSHWGHSE